MKKTAFNILLLLTACAVFAQNRSSNPLSRFGYGDIQDKNYALGDALNGASTALRSPDHINAANPAALTALDSMSFIFEVGMSSMKATYKQGDQSQETNNSGLDYISFSFPIAKFWKTAAGVQPFSFNGYSFKIEDHDTPTDDSVRYRVIGSGGLSNVYWSNAFEPVKGLSIGVEAAFIFGESRRFAENFHHNYRDKNNPDIAITTKTDTIHTKGFVFSAGVQYEYEFKNKTRLSAGATYRPKQSLKYEGSGTVSSTYLNMADYNYSGVSTDIPQSWAVGLAYHKDDHYLVSADFETVNWSDAKVYSEHEGAEQIAFKDYQRVSLGGEWLPEKYSRHYFKRVKYRLGVKYENKHWAPVLLDGRVAEYTNMSVSAGLGLPFKQTRNSLNLMVEVGMHDASEDDALTNEYLIFKANISLFDKWFHKRKID